MTELATRMAVLEAQVVTLVAKTTELEARTMSIAETAQRLVLLEEQRTHRDNNLAQKIDALTDRVMTPPPPNHAQDRLLQLMEAQIDRAHQTAEHAQNQLSQEGSKSTKWMRDLIIVLVSSVVGGGAINGVLQTAIVPSAMPAPIPIETSIPLEPLPVPPESTP